MPDIRELRDRIRKYDHVLAQIRASIADIQRQEVLLFNQAMSGVFDTVPDAALKQKLVQLDAYREDRYSLIEQETDAEAERQAMCEEVVNLLRRRVGLTDLPDISDRPLVTMEADDHLKGPSPSPHPGTVPPVINHRKNR